MTKEKIKIEKEKDDDNILVVRVKVDSKADAFEIVSELGFFNEVLSAKFNEFDEAFDDDHKPANFTRKKVKKVAEVRDVKKEVIKQTKKLKEQIWD